MQTRDYGICLYLLNRFSEAIPCLEAYIQVWQFSDDISVNDTMEWWATSADCGVLLHRKRRGQLMQNLWGHCLQKCDGTKCLEEERYSCWWRRNCNTIVTETFGAQHILSHLLYILYKSMNLKDRPHELSLLQEGTWNVMPCQGECVWTYGCLGYEFVKRLHLCLECCLCIGNDDFLMSRMLFIY